MANDDFECIVHDHEARIVRYLAGILGDTALAQDLAQETFLRVHRSLQDLADPGARTAWVFRIAHNLAVDYRRSRASRQEALTTSLDEDPLVAEHTETEDFTAERQLEEKEMSACMRGYIQELSPSLRECLILRDIEGLGEQTVAEIMRCSVGAVKVRTHRARRQLREVLRRQCDFYQDQRGVLMCEPAESRSKCTKTGD